jgi:death on curing protein
VSGGEIQFLNLEDVLILHEMQIERYGGATGIRDQGLLESAIGMPQASFGGEFMHKGLFEMAAAYAFHIAENQPFVDGNKRTALAAALVFLDWHHIEVEEPNGELYTAMIQLAERKLESGNLLKIISG